MSQNNYEEKISHLKNVIGQYKYERLKAVVKILEESGIRYNLKYLASLSRKSLLSVKVQAIAIKPQIKISHVRDSTHE